MAKELQKDFSAKNVMIPKISPCVRGQQSGPRDTATLTCGPTAASAPHGRGVMTETLSCCLILTEKAGRPLPCDHMQPCGVLTRNV